MQSPLWSIFEVGDIFDIKNGYGITKEDIDLNKGNIPAIQGGEDNNGIIGYLCDKMNFLLIDEPCLTLARVGSAGAINFYTKCYIGDKAKALILNKKYINFKNKYVYIFIKTILNLNKYRYSYGKGVVTEKYLKNKIVLPIDANGNPNWEYMEEYIKSLPYSKYL